MDANMRYFYKKKNEDLSYHKIIKLKDISRPICLLLGPNGTGKSMSLKSIEHELDEANIKWVKYSTSNNDIVHTSWDFDPTDIINAFRSEGERMCASFDKWGAQKLVPLVLKTKEPLWVLLDEIDSGLSLDRIKQTVSIIKMIFAGEYQKNREIHFIITCNSYELYSSIQHDEFTQNIWVPTNSSFYPKTYDEFKKPYLEYYDKVHKEEDESERVA